MSDERIVHVASAKEPTSLHGVLTALPIQNVLGGATHHLQKPSQVLKILPPLQRIQGQRDVQGALAFKQKALYYKTGQGSSMKRIKCKVACKVLLMHDACCRNYGRCLPGKDSPLLQAESVTLDGIQSDGQKSHTVNHRDWHFCQLHTWMLEL